MKIEKKNQQPNLYVHVSYFKVSTPFISTLWLYISDSFKISHIAFVLSENKNFDDARNDQSMDKTNPTKSERP